MGERYRVLIVDDEPRITETLARIFTTHGYETGVASSAEEALRVVEEWRPDLALLDVVLPSMNGVDLGILLRSSFPGCKILLFSGQTITMEFLDRALNEGHLFEILAKPVAPVVLLKKVADLLAEGPGAAEVVAPHPE